MSLVKWLIIGLLLLPIVEIAALLLVAATIGWLWVLAAVVAAAVTGAAMPRRSGLSNLGRLRAAAEADGIKAINLDSPGLAAIAAGILLIIPGFITDLAAAALLIPPVRRWALHVFRRRQLVRKPPPTGSKTIDLGPDDWRQVSERPMSDTPIEDRRDRKLRR
jgi:UPF0716 protein FxsA